MQVAGDLGPVKGTSVVTPSTTTWLLKHAQLARSSRFELSLVEFGLFRREKAVGWRAIDSRKS